MTPHILCTGTSRGIGRAIVAALGHDARVIGHAARPTAAPDIVPADFAEPGAAAALWAEALDRLDGRIDVLVNNAGIFEAAPLAAADADWSAAWGRTMQVNLTAAAELSRRAVAHMAGHGGGRIVSVASRAAHRGDSPDHWAYAASKAGLVALTKTIARGYARNGVLAFAICPGFTLNGPADEYLASRGGPALLADIPLGRVTEAEEVAAAVRFLALDAPAAMTGAILDINGASYVR